MVSDMLHTVVSLWICMQQKTSTRFSMIMYTFLEGICVHVVIQGESLISALRNTCIMLKWPVCGHKIKGAVGWSRHCVMNNNTLLDTY